jgi:PAS domain S-box-containing protein
MNQAQKRSSETAEAVAVAGVTLPDPQPDIQQQRVELVFEQAPAALGAGFIVALVLTASLWGVADQSLLLSWFGAQLLLTAMRFLHVYRYRKTCQEARKDPRWEKFFFIGTLMSGITWGCIGMIYSPNWAVEYQVLVVICIIGLQAGAVSSYAAITGIYIAFMAPSILIFTQSLMAHPGGSHSVMGLMFLVGGGVLLAISRNISKSILMSLQFRYEHQDLMRKMSVTNNSLEIEISTRQEAENELLRERRLFTEGPVIVYRCRAESGWPVEYISETISGLGYDAENIMKQQMPLENFIYPGDLQRVKESELLVGRNGALSLGLDYRLLCADGTVRWVYDYIVPVINGTGEITHYAGYMLDITDRKNAEFELQKERDRVQVTLHSIADAVITTDINGQIEYLNPMAEELTGWGNEIAHGLSISRIFCLFDEESRESLEDPVSHCLASADVFKSDKDAILRRHDGDKFSIQYSVSPINNDEGVPQGVIIVFNDVTGTRNMERTISYQAAHDSLTGLINRREFEIQLEDALQATGSGNTQHALCCLNIDQFKIVNDTCCHDAGDKLLIDVTGVLRGYMRETDILSRIGGDEFACR